MAELTPLNGPMSVRSPLSVAVHIHDQIPLQKLLVRFVAGAEVGYPARPLLARVEYTSVRERHEVAKVTNSFIELNVPIYHVLRRGISVAWAMGTAQ